MEGLFGVMIVIGLFPQDYFSTNWIKYMPFLADCFTRDRFLLLFYNLDLKEEEAGRGGKIKLFFQKHKQEMPRTVYT